MVLEGLKLMVSACDWFVFVALLLKPTTMAELTPIPSPMPTLPPDALANALVWPKECQTPPGRFTVSGAVPKIEPVAVANVALIMVDGPAATLTVSAVDE